jgi:DNA polymerase elongation subunit (family B)
LSHPKVSIVLSGSHLKYGTTGSFWNRFANVAAFEEINKLSREILIKPKDIIRGMEFELVYADTDSVFLKRFR